MPEYAQDRQWSDLYLPAIETIFCEQAAIPIDTIYVSSPDEDRDLGQDLVVRLAIGRVLTFAVRLRRLDGTPWRDLTIRSYRENRLTELAKIAKGRHADGYFYGWATGGSIPEWAIVDIGCCYGSGALTNRPQISNKDGETKFIAVPFSELVHTPCVFRYHISGL